MGAPFTDRQMDQLDAVATRRAQAEDWASTKPTKTESAKVQEALAAMLDDPLGLFAVRAEDDYEAAPVALPYVGWVTTERCGPQRIDIAPVRSKDEALALAHTAAASIAARAGASKFTVSVRPA